MGQIFWWLKSGQIVGVLGEIFYLVNVELIKNDYNYYVVFVSYLVLGYIWFMGYKFVILV